MYSDQRWSRVEELFLLNLQPNIWILKAVTAILEIPRSEEDSNRIYLDIVQTSASWFSLGTNSFVVLKRNVKPMGIPSISHYLEKLAEGWFGRTWKKVSACSHLIKLSELQLLPLNCNPSDDAIKKMDSRIWSISVWQVVIITESSAYVVITFFESNRFIPLNCLAARIISSAAKLN